MRKRQREREKGRVVDRERGREGGKEREIERKLMQAKSCILFMTSLRSHIVSLLPCSVC